MNDLINGYIPIFAMAQCQVCGAPTPVDRFGCGKCRHCGWYQESHGIQDPDDVIYPNVVSYKKAKALVAQCLPLTPSFDDFIEGLKYYKEMEFEYGAIMYAVCFRRDGVYFSTYNGEALQLYATCADFKAHAHIDDKLLIDIWDNVQNADYM